MKSFWSALARQRFKTAPPEFKSGVQPPHSKWLPLLIVAAVTSLTFADDLAQLYEKAYFLETAKGQTGEALKIYRQIAATEVNNENFAAVTKALKRLQDIYSTLNLAEDTKQGRFEKAIALTRLGQNRQAVEIFQALSAPVHVARTPNTDEHSFHCDVLDELLKIAIEEEHQKDIAGIQARMLKETDDTIHSLILKMPPGGTVYLPNGVYSGNKLAYHDNRNIWIKKEITLRGESRDKCIIEGTMDRPIIHAKNGSKLTLDSLALRSQILNYNKDQSLEEIGCSLKIDNNGSATLTNCSVIAAGNLHRSPLAICTEGFSRVDMVDCRISGFAIPVFFGDGSSGNIEESIIQNELKTHPNTEILIKETVFHDSAYYAINCGGGNLSMESCLIVNAGRALSIGWNTEKLSLSNSAVINCGNILTHHRSRVSRTGTITINHNVFSYNVPDLTNVLIRESGSYDSATFIMRNNILLKNKTENWNQAFAEKCMNSGPNVFWENEGRISPASNPDETLFADPELKEPENGDFTPQNPKVLEAGHGLSNPGAIQALWKKYEMITKDK